MSSNRREGRIWSDGRRSCGQASVELVAILPALIVCVVIAASAIPAGWAMWSAANAARAGARAEHVGGDGEEAARRALPKQLREEAKAKSGEELRVSVRAPALVAGFERPRMGAATRLDPADGD